MPPRTSGSSASARPARSLSQKSPPMISTKNGETKFDDHRTNKTLNAPHSTVVPAKGDLCVTVTPAPTHRHSRTSPADHSRTHPPSFPHPPTVIPAPTHRHSRESGNPGWGSRLAGSASPSQPRPSRRVTQRSPKAGIQGGAPGWRGLLPQHTLPTATPSQSRRAATRPPMPSRDHWAWEWHTHGWTLRPPQSRRAATRPPMPSHDHCFHSTPMLDRDPHKAVAQRPVAPATAGGDSTQPKKEVRQ